MSGPAAARDPLWRRLAPHLLAGVVFALAAGLVFGEVWRAGARTHVPVRDTLLQRAGSRADVVFETWLVSRHARTLVTAPHRLFHTEHCAPVEKSLALGIPMVAMGFLAIPSFLATGDPVLTWNLTLVLLSLVGAAAMYALVVSWTGVPAAGIAAGLLFGLHPTRLFDITHPSVWDTTWIVLGLLFAERLSAHGRWRDVAGLAAAVTLQIGASFYTLLAAVCVGMPFALWLLARDRLRPVRAAQILALLGLTALAAWALLGPYLEVRTATTGGGGLGRTRFLYAAPRDLAPGGPLFPGFVALLLALVALGTPRARLPLRIPGDPRWVLLAGGGLAAWLALGERAAPLPDLHALLAGLLPGLDAVRVLMRVASGAHLVMALLAGLGAALLLRASGRAGPAAAALLVGVCLFDVVRAPALGFERRWQWTLEAVAPDPRDLAFFAALEEMGNDGALLEPPVDMFMARRRLGPPRIMSSLFHGRRTSACFGSYTPDGLSRLVRLTRRLPEQEAVDALAAMGFTTVVLRETRADTSASPLLLRLHRAAGRERGVQHLLTAHGRTAFALQPSDAAQVPSRPPG